MESGGLADLEIVNNDHVMSFHEGNIYQISYRNYKNADKRISEEGSPQGVLLSGHYVGDAHTWRACMQEYAVFDLEIVE